MYYYEVAPLKIVRADSAIFTYHSTQPLAIGQFVHVPVGRTTHVALVVHEVAKPSFATKQAISLNTIPALPVGLIDTAKWMSEYYATHLATTLQTILPRGLTKKRRSLSKSTSVFFRSRTKIVFNESQQSAIDTIAAMSPGTALLHGITGSGKTAVYVELVRRTLAHHQSAIVLVPEIALTSQLVADFTQHFPNIVVTHSRQREAERHTIWLKVATHDQPLVIIGPRSALFMPAKNLGLIVIDEAHEPSYKQEQSPRYSALRVASILAQNTHAKVIQGSATPLVSEYYLATMAKRPIITMNHKARPDTVAPTVTCIDMTKRSHFSRHRLFSNELLKALEQNLEQEQQSLIFHNRRGSASTTLCEHCGWSALCERCFVPLTLHADLHRLECHICGHTSTVPTSCPVCSSTDVIHKGIGTKLIEAELRRLFPAARIARFDGDAANGHTVEQQYQALYDGSIDIIIGTQIIAKGLDLPKLRLVGVVQADAGLALPDFMASERTFQLLAQVVGRVGRSSHSTTVIVQSYQPDAPAVKLGLAQRYNDFYNQALVLRQKSNFPPFTYLLKLTCIYKTEAAAIRNATNLAVTLRKKFPDIQILGPTPSFYERQHDTYRWQLVVKSPRRALLIEVLRQVPLAHWQTNLDPISLL